ncbi:MAG: hypothetical protein HWD61_01485 [Parachlamydiaceae bacterium]|nr:MAG: hypothetical protein HWD61_01485 [Parachlamydiaceae bacterium]
MHRKFFRWFIHLITCHRVPRNERLDKVTLSVLQETLPLDFCAMESQERSLIKKAILNLSQIVKKWWGRTTQDKRPFIKDSES